MRTEGRRNCAEMVNSGQPLNPHSGTGVKYCFRDQELVRSGRRMREQSAGTGRAYARTDPWCRRPGLSRSVAQAGVHPGKTL